MINIVIIEDEAPARNLLKHYLKRHHDLTVVAECANGFEGVKAINKYKPELIFLDVQMPKLNGFEMLELVNTMPQVIFTTAYDEYAIKAFEINAVDYLLKPFGQERFDNALLKVKKHMGESSEMNIIKASEITATQPLEQIVVSVGNKIEILTPEDVFMIEAQDDYVMIYTEKEQFLKKKTMQFYENNLQADFIRVHRSYIINIQKIDNIELYGKQQYYVKLKNNCSVKTSKSGYKKIKEKFM